MKNPNLLLDILHGNIFVQITSGSLIGEFGRDEQACSSYLLRKKAVHFISTDAHSNDYRRPILSEGLRQAEKIVGMNLAKKLVLDNPRAVLNDETILHV